MIRVLVVDDHTLVREGLRKVFDREDDIEVAAEARDAAEALAVVKSQALEVVIMDFNLPGRTGLDAVTHIHTVRPALPVLMLSMMPEREIVLRAFKAGVAGFVSKEGAADEIVTAVRRVASGNKYVSPTAADLLVADVGGAGDVNPHDTLSDREFQVVRLIASGMNTREISENLSLSVNTVATYRRRIYEKLGVGSDVEITRYALEHRLID